MRTNSTKNFLPVNYRSGQNTELQKELLHLFCFTQKLIFRITRIQESSYSKAQKEEKIKKIFYSFYNHLESLKIFTADNKSLLLRELSGQLNTVMANDPLDFLFHKKNKD